MVSNNGDSRRGFMISHPMPSFLDKMRRCHRIYSCKFDASSLRKPTQMPLYRRHSRKRLGTFIYAPSRYTLVRCQTCLISLLRLAWLRSHPSPVPTSLGMSAPACVLLYAPDGGRKLCGNIDTLGGLRWAFPCSCPTTWTGT